MSEPTIDECLVWINKAVGHTEDSAWIAGFNVANSKMLKAIRAILEQHRNNFYNHQFNQLIIIRAFVERTEKRAHETARSPEYWCEAFAEAIANELKALESNERDAKCAN